MTVSALAGGGKELPTREGRSRPRLQFDVPLQVGGLQIIWLEVQDSRCAEGVVCVWEGEVTARIQVSEAGEDLGTFALTLNRAGQDKTLVQVGGHAIRLLAIGPKHAKTDQAVLAVTLEGNKPKWRANDLENYRFNFQRSFFCLRDFTRE